MASMLDGCTPWPEEFVDRYWSVGLWRGNTLDNLLRGWALQYGPRTALVHGDTRLTYAALNRRVDRRAAGFRLRGLRPGQRVVVQLPNVPECVVTVFALMRAGAVPVFCPLAHPASGVAELVRVTQAVGYVAASDHPFFDHTALAADIAARWPFLRRVFTLEAPGDASPYGGLTTDPSGCQYSPLSSVDAAPEPALAQSADQVAFFLLSDRGTERPPLVPRTHDDFACQALAAAGLVALTEDDVCLVVPPAETPFALGSPGIVGTLSAGGTVVLAGTADPAECLPVAERERVTVMSVPAEVARVWLDTHATVPADLGSLRLVQLDGAPADRATAERVAAAWGCRPQQVFGMAEGVLLLTRPTDPDGTALGTHGRPLSSDDQIRIVDADGANVPDGEPGELLARGPSIPRGYYREPERNARSFTADGWFRTGRLARRTAEGDLEVTGHLPGRDAEETHT
ncbi:AMP-binding protein [Streptomyces sp. NPDC014870]|uniref:AMP-binding protein n=1 Tax=Streptomyces sp. NPDC014870 TaxID=3364925 RepID=UPI0037006AE8